RCGARCRPGRRCDHQTICSALERQDDCRESPGLRIGSRFVRRAPVSASSAVLLRWYGWVIDCIAAAREVCHPESIATGPSRVLRGGGFDLTAAAVPAALR